MTSVPSEEGDTSPVRSSPKPSGAPTAPSTTSGAPSAPEMSSKQRIQQLRERLAQYNVTIAENLSHNATSTSATSATGAAAKPVPPSIEVPASPSSPTHRIARNLSSEFQQSTTSAFRTESTTGAAAAGSPPRRASESTASTMRRSSSPAPPGSPLRHAPQPITPKMMNDITASLPVPASTATGVTGATNASTVSRTASATFRTTSASHGNPFQPEHTDIHQPRQRASVDMMEEAVRRSSTVSTEAAVRAAQQEQFAQAQRRESSPTYSPYASQRPSFTTQAATTRTGAGRTHTRHHSPSPHEPKVTLSSSDEESDGEYEELEFDVEEIEEEFEETDTDDETSSYDDEGDEEDDDAVNAFLHELLEKDDYIRDAVEKTLSQSGQIPERARTMDPLIRRATELYRQRRQQQQQQQQSSPLQPRHNDPAVAKGPSPTAVPAAVASSNEQFSASAVADLVARGGSVSFGQLETAHWHLISAHLGTEKMNNLLRPANIPAELPVLHETAVLAARRDELTTSLQELCRTPATQRQLGSLKQTEASELHKKCRALLDACQTYMSAKPLKLVLDQQAIVAGKEKLLAQRQDDLRERRAACRAVREETLKIKRRNATRAAHLKSREETYARRLEEHATMEANTRTHIAEVEELGKKVTWWLRVLEERNASLTQKEERLVHMETDVARRRGDLDVFRGPSSRAGKNPPPPPPPRSSQGTRL